MVALNSRLTVTRWFPCTSSVQWKVFGSWSWVARYFSPFVHCSCSWAVEEAPNLNRSKVARIRATTTNLRRFMGANLFPEDNKTQETSKNYYHIMCNCVHFDFCEKLPVTLLPDRFNYARWWYTREAVLPGNAADQESQIEGSDLLIRKALKVARVVNSFYASIQLSYMTL